MTTPIVCTTWVDSVNYRFVSRGKLDSPDLLPAHHGPVLGLAAALMLRPEDQDGPRQGGRERRRHAGSLSPTPVAPAKCRGFPLSKTQRALRARGEKDEPARNLSMTVVRGAEQP